MKSRPVNSSIYRLHLPHKLVILIAVLLLSGCSSSLSLNDFDTVTWKTDRQGCEGTRFQYLSTIDSNRDYLLRRNQNELEELLGLPDEHELDERRRKYFYYYFEPGPQCPDTKPYPKRLRIKFNAVGISEEVFIENI